MKQHTKPKGRRIRATTKAFRQRAATGSSRQGEQAEDAANRTVLTLSSTVFLSDPLELTLRARCALQTPTWQGGPPRASRAPSRLVALPPASSRISVIGETSLSPSPIDQGGVPAPWNPAASSAAGSVPAPSTHDHRSLLRPSGHP